MDNMGGLNRLYYIDADDIVSLVEGSDNMKIMTLDEAAAAVEIVFTKDTGKITENEEDTDNGRIYNFEAVCTIPKCGPGNTDITNGMRDKRILILASDNNGRLWLTGYPGSYFSITTGSSTGDAPQAMNSRRLKITALFPEQSVFLESLP